MNALARLHGRRLTSSAQIRAAGPRCRHVARHADPGPAQRGPTSSPSSSGDKPKDTPSAFQQVEGLILSNANNRGPEGRSDWQKVEDCWVLGPPDDAGPAEAVVMFVGGAFVGAAPQVTYRLFLEKLAARNVLIVAVPYETGFDHERISDDVQLKMTTCLRAIAPEIRNLPVYGAGHSLGSLLTLMVNSRFGVHRDGNALLSFNNRPATDSIPILTPLLGPGASAVGPILTQLANSPMRAQIDTAFQLLRTMAPGSVKSVLPLVEQLEPIFMDVANGRQDFSPSPAEADKLLKTYYNVSKNLLIRFEDDQIDETPRLIKMLQDEAAISAAVDVTIRTLPGDHVRPLAQNIGDLPPELASFATTAAKSGGTVLGNLSSMASQFGFSQAEGPLRDLGKQVDSMSASVGESPGKSMTESASELADEVAAWMGVGGVPPRKGQALPSSASPASAA